MSGKVPAPVLVAWPWALSMEQAEVASKLLCGMFKISDNLLAGREWNDPPPEKGFVEKAVKVTLYDGYASFDGEGNVTISVEEFNQLQDTRRRLGDLVDNAVAFILQCKADRKIPGSHPNATFSDQMTDLAAMLRSVLTTPGDKAYCVRIGGRCDKCPAVCAQRVVRCDERLVPEGSVG
jgi:hypothetical protein